MFHEVCNEEDYPYHAADERCLEESCNTDVKVRSFQHILPNNTAAMKAAINKAPISVGVCAGNHDWQHYKEGVMQQAANCQDHYVVAVGYGVCEESHLEYIKLRNNMGEKWGMAGYVRLSTGLAAQGGHSGVLMQPMYPMLDARE